MAPTYNPLENCHPVFSRLSGSLREKIFAEESFVEFNFAVDTPRNSIFFLSERLYFNQYPKVFFFCTKTANLNSAKISSLKVYSVSYTKPVIKLIIFYYFTASKICFTYCVQVYWVGDMLGAALAALTYEYIFKLKNTKKPAEETKSQNFSIRSDTADFKLKEFGNNGVIENSKAS